MIRSNLGYWNGAVVEDVETVQRFAQTMTNKGLHPVVTLVTQTSKTGVKLTKQAMVEVENQLLRF